MSQTSLKDVLKSLSIRKTQQEAILAIYETTEDLLDDENVEDILKTLKKVGKITRNKILDYIGQHKRDNSDKEKEKEVTITEIVKSLSKDVRTTIKYNYETVDDLCEDLDNLTMLDGIGPKTQNQVQTILKSKGYEIKESDLAKLKRMSKLTKKQCKSILTFYSLKELQKMDSYDELFELNGIGPKSIVKLEKCFKKII